MEMPPKQLTSKLTLNCLQHAYLVAILSATYSNNEIIKYRIFSINSHG